MHDRDARRPSGSASGGRQQIRVGDRAVSIRASLITCEGRLGDASLIYAGQPVS